MININSIKSIISIKRISNIKNIKNIISNITSNISMTSINSHYNTVRASFNVGLNDKTHDETRAKADINVNDISKDVVNKVIGDITRGYRDYNERYNAGTRNCGI